MLCHPCAPGTQCWLSQQVAPLCRCQCQTFSPQGKFQESPCHTKAHVVSFSSHEEKGYMSVTALFKWVQLFPIFIASFHIHSQSCRHWKALVQRKNMLPEFKFYLFFLHQWPNRRLIPAIFLLSGRTENTITFLSFYLMWLKWFCWNSDLFILL